MSNLLISTAIRRYVWYKEISAGCTGIYFHRSHFHFLAYLRLLELMESDEIQGGSNMTGTDLCVNKPHCAAVVRP